MKRAIKEAIDMKSLSKSTVDPWVLMYQTNAVVSPTVPFDTPMNDDYIPQNKLEFEVAVKSLIKDVENVDVPKLFKLVKELVENFISEQEEDDMKKMKKESIDQQIRNSVKKILTEGGLNPDLYAQPDYGSEDDDIPGPIDRQNKRKFFRKGDVETGSELGLADYKTIADAMGVSVAAVKDNVLAKLLAPKGRGLAGGLGKGDEQLLDIICAVAPDLALSMGLTQDEIEAREDRGMELVAKKEKQRGAQELAGETGALPPREQSAPNFMIKFVNDLAASGALDEEDVAYLLKNPHALASTPMYKNAQFITSMRDSGDGDVATEFYEASIELGLLDAMDPELYKREYRTFKNQPDERTRDEFLNSLAAKYEVADTAVEENARQRSKLSDAVIARSYITKLAPKLSESQTRYLENNVNVVLQLEGFNVYRSQFKKRV